MKKQLFLYTTLLVLAGLLSFAGISVLITHANNVQFAKDAVMETAENYAGLYNSVTDISSLVQTSNDTRITVIAPDGRVLADSRQLDIDALENHLDRPEVLSASADTPEAFIRYSDTLGVDMVYYAVKVGSNGGHAFLRVALPIAKIDAYLLKSLPLLALMVLMISVICFFICRGISERIVKHFESIEQKLRSLLSGTHTPDSVVGGYEEIDRIVRSIDEVAEVLQQSFSTLRDEKSKLDYILENMGDGLIVIDESRRIALSNMAALNTFNANPDVAGNHISYLTYDQSLMAAVDACIDHEESALFELPLNGRIFFVAVKRLPATALTSVILSDITETRENARQREEFFANASHELKTPLASIKGFSELLSINNTDETLQKFIDGIARSTERILTLIEDMLKLSELEVTRDIHPVSLSLSGVVKEVYEALSIAISEKDIAFQISGDASVRADPTHVYDLVKNLVENAIRHNNQGGRVTVTIEAENTDARLFIADNGIGIPPKDQQRIYERFYRVEKGRAARNGGTGLGLAIVKHICALYGWRLSLKSKLGVGTEVSVLFHSQPA